MGRGPTLAEEDGRIDEATIEGIWTTIMLQLCNRHRTQARNVKPTADNPRPTDWKIEDLRKRHYKGGYPDAEYFRRHIVELARRYPEIQVNEKGDVIRLTSKGLDYCEKYVRGWQKDFVAVEIPQADVESFTENTIKKNKDLFERLANA